MNRVGTFYWGNQHCQLLEVQPFFSVLAGKQFTSMYACKVHMIHIPG